MKLQRNALSVIEAPTGYEEDDEEVVDFSSSTGSDLVPRSSPRRKLVRFKSLRIISTFLDTSRMLTV